jgi:O-antigen/teichoic acid export membrane protein
LKQRGALLTFLCGVVNALAGFGIALFTARALGAEGRGAVSAVMLNVTLIQTFGAVVGSSAVMYFLPRHPLGSIVLLAGAWNLISSFIIVLCLFFLGIADRHELLLLWGVSVLQASATLNSLILLSRSGAGQYNLARVAQPLLMLVALAVAGRFSPGLFFRALLYSSFAACIISSLAVVRYWEAPQRSGIFRLLREFLVKGGQNQAAILLQFFNYRLSFYLLRTTAGLSALGVFSIAAAVAESVWIYRQSVSAMYLKDVSENSEAPELFLRNRQLIVKSAGVTALMLLGFLGLPKEVFTVVFGRDFAPVKALVVLLAPGILAVSGSSIVAYYFAGIGRPKYGLFATAAAFVTAVLLGVLLVPGYGIRGAAIANTSAALVSSGTLFILYRRFLRRKRSAA